MAENRDFKGIWIPKNIWLSKDLTPLQKFFLTEIDSLDNDFGCTANNKYFADFFNCSESSASKSINVLWKKGFITLEYNANSSRIIKMKKAFEGGSKKVEHNNTFNNTSNKSSSSSFVEAEANLKIQNAKSDPNGIIDNVPPIESKIKVISRKKGQATITSGQRSAEKEIPKTSMLSHAVDFNKIEFSKIAEILFTFNDSKFRQSQIRFGHVTNENFKDAVEAFLVQTSATEPIKHITVKDLAKHFENWCNTVQKDKIEHKIKALKKTTDVTSRKLSIQDEFKAIQADLIEKIKKGELTERKALQIAAEKKKELGIQ